MAFPPWMTLDLMISHMVGPSCALHGFPGKRAAAIRRLLSKGFFILLDAVTFFDFTVSETVGIQKL